ncbi:MAG: trypsin-like peptidase domain-containing protein [Verrucomicrobia bacterium]|nr:trypsin-like peptidase domain-containing protein [Verrucomicrobiota bacterium]
MKIFQRHFALTAALAAAPFFTLGGELDPRRDSVVEAVQRAMPSVVNIRTETLVERHDPYERLLREFWGPMFGRPWMEKNISLGSGVIIDEEGWVLTNFHVAWRATSIFVKLSDGREFEAEAVVGTSFTDIALLKIKTTKPEKFSAIKFAADDDLLLGETVLALGNPFGLGGSVTRGILSSKTRRPPRENQALEVEDWLQTDAAINPGNSGGPLINLRGELIGVNVAVYQEGQGIGFAIPAKRVSSALAEMYSPENPPAGGEPMWFGARVRPGALPLIVASVQAESPAAKAGLRAGDQVLHINHRAPRSFIDFSNELIRRAKESPPLCSLTVQRGTEKQNLTVRLIPEKDYFNSDMVRQRIGASVQTLTPELAEAFGLAATAIKGVLISDVDPDSPADKAGLKRGMIITSIDNQDTRRFPMLAKALVGKKKGDKVVLDMVIPRQRGYFIQVQQAKVELPVR